MKVLDAQASATAGPVYNVGGPFRSFTRAVQVRINGTGAVQLQGRAAPNAPWVDLGSAFTADGVQLLQLMPQVRGNVTEVSGSADAWVDAF